MIRKVRLLQIFPSSKMGLFSQLIGCSARLATSQSLFLLYKNDQEKIIIIMIIKYEKYDVFKSFHPSSWRLVFSVD